MYTFLSLRYRISSVFFILFLDTKESFETQPPEFLGEYLSSKELIVLKENDQYRFSNLAESREAIKAAGL